MGKDLPAALQDPQFTSTLIYAKLQNNTTVTLHAREQGRITQCAQCARAQ